MKHASFPGRWTRSLTPGVFCLLLLWATAALTPLAAAETNALATGPADAGTTTMPAAAEETAPFDFWDWFIHTGRLTGEWGGWRPKLEDKGFKLAVYYNQFWAAKDNGGADEKSGNAFSGSLDIFGMVDFEKLGWIPGGEALIQVKNNWGYSINPEVGAWGAPIDDADGDIHLYIDQFYYQQSLASKKFQARIGYLDQQTILDRNAYANSEDVQFMNTFLDNNNAIIPLAIGPGISLFYNPTDWVHFILGMADADSRLNHWPLNTTFDDGDFYGFFETGFKFYLNTTKGKLPGNYRLGGLYDPREGTYWGTGGAGQPPAQLKRHTFGFYLSFDQMVYAESERDQQGLGLFARYGWRNGDSDIGGYYNKIEHFWSVGAQYLGLIPTRDTDALGFGMYSAIASSSYREQHEPEADRETGYEIYYRAQLTPAIAFSPGFQYISQPGGLKTRKDAMVVALRARFSF